MKIVFLPLLTFEVIILIDNFRMCKALMPGDEESMSDEAIWETLPVSYLVLMDLSIGTFLNFTVQLLFIEQFLLHLLLFTRKLILKLWLDTNAF
jgi:hypothetical protein